MILGFHMKLSRHKFLARKEGKLYVYQIIRFLHTDAYTNMYDIISTDMQNTHTHTYAHTYFCTESPLFL